MKHRIVQRGISEFRFHQHNDIVYINVKIQGGWLSFPLDTVPKSMIHSVQIVLEIESLDDANP